MATGLWDPLAALTHPQRQLMEQYVEELRAFNRQINLVSREDEDTIMQHHVRHCLALTYRPFPPGARVVDWGTGGGLPAIPLAIAHPTVTVHAVDTVGKKVRAVRAMARRLRLDNLRAWHARAEGWRQPIDYSVSRATAPLATLWQWHAATRAIPLTKSADMTCWHKGLICLKGGDLSDEIAQLQATCTRVNIRTIALAPLLGDPYFADKYLVLADD